MSNKRRLIIIIMSVLMGTMLSALLFMMRRGGKLTDSDYTNLFSNMAFALAIVIFIGIFLVARKKR